MTPEGDVILGVFNDMLAAVVADGQRKRTTGIKPHWTVDPEHEAGLWSHINRWKHGELSDPDSGTHPLVHAAFRCLAIAHQEMHREMH